MQQELDPNFHISSIRGSKKDGATLVRDKLKITEYDLQFFSRWMDLIKENHLPAGEELSQQDFELQLLHLHSLNCLDLSFPLIKFHPNAAGARVTKCLNHPEKDASWICVNNNCPLQLFCNVCKKTHHKCCSRHRLVVPLKTVLKADDFGSDGELIDDSGDEREIIGEIEDLGDNMKKTFGQYVDLLVLQWKNRLKTCSRRSLYEYSKKSIVEKRREFEGSFFIAILFQIYFYKNCNKFFWTNLN